MEEKNKEWTSETFKSMYTTDIKKYVETKGEKVKLEYLSWTYAVKIVSELEGADFNYIVKTNPMGLPYFGESEIGYFVSTSVSLFGKTKEMTLPVLDNNNNAVKTEPYQIKLKNGYTQNVNAIDSFMINTAIMRCLVKNIALFGLGLSLYTGEDTKYYDADAPQNNGRPQNQNREKPQQEQKPTPPPVNKPTQEQKKISTLFDKTPAEFTNTLLKGGFMEAKNHEDRCINVINTMINYINYNNLKIEIPRGRDAEAAQLLFDKILALTTRTTDFAANPFDKKQAPDYSNPPLSPQEQDNEKYLTLEFYTEIQEAIEAVESGGLDNSEQDQLQKKFMPLISKFIPVGNFSSKNFIDGLYALSDFIDNNTNKE